MTLRFNLRLHLTVLVCLAANSSFDTVRAASVGVAGYTNSFSTLPVVADWSTVSRVTDAATFGSIPVLDAGVQATTAATVNTVLGTVAADPPAAAGLAQHCSVGSQYLQTWPTGNGATFLMCTLVNGTTTTAGGALVSYDYVKIAGAGEEIDGHRAYFSRTGAINTWTPIPQFSTVSPGRLTASLSFTWPAGSTVYILWADDNAATNPDAGNQIDNFSAATIPVAPLTIASQPQSQTNIVGTQTILCVGVSGSAPVYQWQTNNGAGVWINLPGATFSCYTNATSPFSAAAQYRVIATNSVNSITSMVATVVIVPDLAGPILSSAVVSELGTTNQITVTFSEKLSFATVNFPPANSNNFVVFARSAGATNQVNVENVFYNSGVVGSPESFAVVRVGGPNWNTGSNAYNGTISYYVIVNNVRDVVGNVIAPNSAVGLSFQNNLTTNVLNWNGLWEYHVDWGNPFTPDPTIYQQPWNQVLYDTATNGHWGLVSGITYKDTLINAETYVPCQGTLGNELGSVVLNPTLFRYTFVWPTNLSTNVTIRLSMNVDDGAIAYINGTEVLRDNVGGSGLPNENTKSTAERADGTCTSNNIVNVSLRPGTNVLAVAVCQSTTVGANGGDIYFGARMDVVQSSLRTGAAPANGSANAPRITIAKVGTNQMRLTWPANIEPTHTNNIYNYTVEYTTNIARVGNNTVLGPWFQMQPGVSNGLTTNFQALRVPYIMRLHKVP